MNSPTATHSETIRIALNRGRARLQAAGTETPALDAALLLAEAAGLSREQLYARENETITGIISAQYNLYLKRREAAEPIAYILGRAEFMSLPFQADRRALIPRPDTETLVETALLKLESIRHPCVLDLCAGSGAVGIAIAHYCPRAAVTAADISADALALARSNAAQNGVLSRMTFTKTDLFAGIAETFDLIATNPPYISEADMAALPKAVRAFEPDIALFGGQDGLAFYRRIIPGAKRHLKPGGVLLTEIGWDQGASVLKLFEENNYHRVTILKDLSGRDRVVTGLWL